MKTLILLVSALSPLLATGPAWDNSGNGLLSGTYNFRQVQYISDGSGSISREIAYFGTIGFDGIGSYKLADANTLVYSGGTLGIPATGTYSVAGSGYGFLSNPLAIGQSIYILVSKGIIIGSSTENAGANQSFNNDLFIAAPVTATLTSSSFNGAYTVANFLPGVDATYALNPDGAGSLGTVVKTGYTLTGAYSASIANASYTFSSGVGLMTIGTNNVNNGVVTSYGQETLYMSPDSSFIFGGSPNGYDFFVGVRNAATSTSLTSGLYYEIGVDEDASSYADDQTATIDTYYGVLNAFSGTVIGHERLLYVGPHFVGVEGVTYTTTYPAGSYTGPANIGQLDPSATVQYTIGVGGIRIGFGIGPWLGIEVAVPADAPKSSGAVYVDPTGIVNTASSAPFTAGISPGEFVSLYGGSNLAASPQCWTAGPPFPTTLGNVQVLINGVAAPIYCIGTPTTVLVPYGVSASPVATIQVVNNNVASNTVTAFVYQTTPGVFSYSPAGGIGFAAAQHAGYILVTHDNPARPGEEIVVYLTGLGSLFCVKAPPPSTVCNAVPDGGPSNPLGDNIVASVEVDVGGFGSTSIPYAGLTPGTVGLYQINFVVPNNAPGGNDVLAIISDGSYTSESLLPVSGGSGAVSVLNPSASRRKTLPRLQGTIHQ